MKKLVFVLSAAATLGMAAPASAVVINASGEGWCRSSGSCNNTSTSTLANTFAGVTAAGGASYRNWFYFNIPIGNYVSAILSISNHAANTTTQPTTVYTTSAASTISFAGLGGGTALGSVVVGTANTGVTHFVDISLNGTGLSLLNSSAGGGFLFGGTVSGTNASTNQVFGYTNGNPVATLTLTSATAVPEPTTWAFMFLGFATTGCLLRRKPAAKQRVRYSFA